MAFDSQSTVLQKLKSLKRRKIKGTKSLLLLELYCFVCVSVCCLSFVFVPVPIFNFQLVTRRREAKDLMLIHSGFVWVRIENGFLLLLLQIIE